MYTSKYLTELTQQISSFIPNVTIKTEYNAKLLTLQFTYVMLYPHMTGIVTFNSLTKIDPEYVAHEIIRQAQNTLKDIMTNNLQ